VSKSALVLPRRPGVRRAEFEACPLRARAIEALPPPPNIFVVVGARLAENGLGYLFPVFGLSCVIDTLHMPRGISSVMLSNVAEIFGIVFFDARAKDDRAGIAVDNMPTAALTFLQRSRGPRASNWSAG
jgi:hypothetical protein